ncbi:MAG: M3 family peptidase [Xanthomonadales bacterium PRO6]|nr:Dipeptidyl carboxypeptidase [Xanthomonadales bacterium]MCE7932535.1 M3 family peptidase [Xanthomonadales bacterium PRO6]
MRKTLLAALIVSALAACSEPATDTTMAPKDAAATQAPATPAAAANPFLTQSTLPLQAPHFDQIKDEHYLPAFEEGMKQHRAEIEAIAAQTEPATFANTIEAMERSGAVLYRVAKVFFNLTESNTNETIQKVQAEVAPKLAQHQDAILLDGRLFARIQALYDTRDTLGLDAESVRLIERYHQNFVRGGATLGEEQKAQLRGLNEKLSSLQTTFQEQLLKDTNASALIVDSAEELDGLSPGDIAAAAETAKERGLEGKWVIALQLPTGQPALTNLKNRAVRERLYKASSMRGNQGNENDTNQLIVEIAKLRAERAALLGAPNHAAYTLESQMAQAPEKAMAMMTGLVPAARANAEAEAAKLQAMIDAEGGGFQLEPWDWAYYAEKVRKAEYDLDDAAVRPYFELERVLNDGVFYAANQLFGITVKERKDLPVYHPDVRVFEVFNADGSTLGLFYADYYARAAKRGGAWMDSFVDQAGLLGTKPVIVNVLNVPKPPAGEPTLLSFDDTNTLFHEFGHALHGLFSNVRYPLLTGTNVPRDFVEFPSQWNENWTLDPKVLRNYAKHYQTGEPIPEELIAKIEAAGKFNQGFATMEYLGAALLDMEWHLQPAGAVIADAQAFERDTLAKYQVDFAPVPPRYRSSYFAHIWPGGYGAGYYSYLWSEVLDADANAWFQANGGLKPENGARFRDLVLSRGDTKPQMQQYQDFAGREPSIEPLLKRRGLEPKG